MLTKIKLENFKSWRELNLDLGRITLLFGTNSSGKSSILKALLLLKQTASVSQQRTTSPNLGGTEQDIADLGSFRDLIFRHQQDQRVGVGLQWDTLMDTNLMEAEGMRFFAGWKTERNRVYLDRLNYQLFAESFSPEVRHEFSGTDMYQVLTPTKGYSLERDYSTLRSERTPMLFYSMHGFFAYPDFEISTLDKKLKISNRQIIGEILQSIGRIQYLGPLRSYPRRSYLARPAEEIGSAGERTVEVLIRSDNREVLLKDISHWLAQLGLVSSFEMRPLDAEDRFYEPRVQIGGDDSALIDVGFGVSQVLPVITLLFTAPEGSTILLEQPELHLHPSAQAGLADLFLHVAEKRNLQLIIESHSEHILARIQRRIAEAENPVATPEQVKAYFCQMGAEGSILEPVRITRFGEVENWPPNFFGDVSGDVEKMSRAGLKRRREEIRQNKGASDQ